MTDADTIASVGQWRPIRGDGSDTMPLGTWYDARLRSGKVERDCEITPFCIRLGREQFRHHGVGSDVLAVRQHLLSEDPA